MSGPHWPVHVTAAVIAILTAGTIVFVLSVVVIVAYLSDRL